MRLKFLLFILTTVIIGLQSMSNNVQVANVSLTDQNSIAHYKFIKCDISWENSWRTTASPNNWDAVWVFAKYRYINGSTWFHATLSDSTSVHVAPTGAEISATTDGKGIFMFKDSDGGGDNAFSNAKLRWEYGVDGLADNDSVEICVFAIEMVFVPEGEYYLGDWDGSGHSSTYSLRDTSTLASALIDTSLTPIESMAANSYDDAQLEGVGVGIDGDGGIDSNGDGTIDNANFPTGYKGFYCMKYEISQGQYVAFANKLSSSQSPNKIVAVSNSYRVNISGSASTTWASTTENRAYTNMEWGDLASYADWSGLRPMTELEFEKAARGTNNTVLYEYAWGNTTIYTTAYTMSSDGTESEGITNMGSNIGNCNWANVDPAGVVRCGIFAANSVNHTREETGASYYGIMELSGNAYELCVTIGDPLGRAYNGLHGDGELASTGNADEANWPGTNGSEVTGRAGSGMRGGSRNYASTNCRISDRTYAGYEVARSTTNAYGGRCVRSYSTITTY